MGDLQLTAVDVNPYTIECDSEEGNRFAHVTLTEDELQGVVKVAAAMNQADRPADDEDGEGVDRILTFDPILMHVYRGHVEPHHWSSFNDGLEMIV